MAKKALATYRQKAIPSGRTERAKKVAASNRFRFVIQKHDARRCTTIFGSSSAAFSSPRRRPPGPLGRSRRQAAGRRSGGSSARLWRLRGHDSGGRVWRWNGATLGPRLLDTGRIQIPRAGASFRRFEIQAGRRATARQLGAGAHEAGSQRRQAHQLAAHQTSRRERALRRGRRADGGGPLGGFGARDERDRRPEKAAPKAIHGAGLQGRGRQCRLEIRSGESGAGERKPATRKQRRRVRQ